jgi:hypothetical protein
MGMITVSRGCYAIPGLQLCRASLRFDFWMVHTHIVCGTAEAVPFQNIISGFGLAVPRRSLDSLDKRWCLR